MSTIYRENGIWRYSWFQDGKRRKKSLKTKDRGIAKLLQAKYDLELSNQTFGITEDKTLEDYFVWFTATHYIGLKKNTQKKDSRIIRRFIAFSKAEKLSQVTTPLILSWLSSKPLSPKTWNNMRGIIKTFFDEAIPKHIQKNPAATVPIKKVPEKHIEFYSDDEYRKIEKSSKEPLKTMIAIARYTGMRIAEILHLHGEDIIFEPNPLIMVKNRPELGFSVKNYQVRSIPLCLELKSILGHFKGKIGLLFEDYRKIHPERALNSVLKEAGVKHPGRAWHLLRHTFASRAVQNGVPLFRVMKWLGHSDYKTTLRYSHLAPEYSPEIEKLNLTATDSATC